MKDRGSNPLEYVMDRKKIYNNVVGWTAWFFCEVAFKFYNAFDYDCLWSDKHDRYVWWFMPFGGIANASYRLGCWFYDKEKD